jgi:hypothetical protein
MRRPCVALALAVLASLAAAQDASVESAPAGGTLRDAAGQFTLELTVEPVAGETLAGGGFELELLGAAPAGAPLGADIFSDSFETGATP